jgi:hypothetical protein
LLAFLFLVEPGFAQPSDPGTTTPPVPTSQSPVQFFRQLLTATGEEVLVHRAERRARRAGHV